MAQERPNRLTEWLLLTRKQVPVVRQHFENWLAAVREEPALVWQTPAVRYATYGAGGLMLVWIATWVAGGLAPPLPEDARPATRADFHVVCTNPECGYHFVIHRKLGFHGFPVKCPRCQQKTGTQARRCNSPTCRGRWVAPEKIEGELHCPVCGGRFWE
ncbi:MAG: hypothetical protein WBE26_00260 [Phycisphaerae bacterium]